jgi:hypothetical protein
MQREVRKYTEVLIGIQLAANSCIKEKREADVQLSLDQFKISDKMPSASTSPKH